MKFKIKISQNNRKKIYIILAILAFAGAAYYGFLHFKAGAKANQNKPAVEVLALKLQSQNVDDFEELPGRTSAYRFAEIRPQVDGIILKRFFTEGSLVKKGQQLYQIDDAPYLAAYNSAKADLEKAKANLVTTKAKNDRFKKLIEVDAVSKQEYDDVIASLGEAKATVAIAKAAVDKAKVYLNYTKVFAPISGRISKSLVTEGSLVAANQAQIITNITQLDPIYVDIARASEDLTQFQSNVKGAAKDQKVPVDLYLNDGTIYQHQGSLQFSEVNVDPSTSSVELRAIFDNPDQILLPGSFVKTRIRINSSNAILIPQKAATRNPDGTLSVWIIDAENKVNPAPINIVKAIGNQWLIKDGLKDGDVIVTEGFQKIAPGALVKAVFPQEKSN
ncbi:MAG: efflux RND transporter periplasmic adaptor subunit [Pseudomonadota bacterium]